MYSMFEHKFILPFLIKLHLMLLLIKVLLFVINVDGRPIRNVFYREDPDSVSRSKSGDFNIYASNADPWSDRYPEAVAGNLVSKSHDTTCLQKRGLV